MIGPEQLPGLILALMDISGRMKSAADKAKYAEIQSILADYSETLSQEKQKSSELLNENTDLKDKIHSLKRELAALTKQQEKAQENVMEGKHAVPLARIICVFAKLGDRAISVHTIMDELKIDAMKAEFYIQELMNDALVARFSMRPVPIYKLTHEGRTWVMENPEAV